MKKEIETRTQYPKKYKAKYYYIVGDDNLPKELVLCFSVEFIDEQLEDGESAFSL